jgi:predicted small secreted protein
LPKPTAAFVIVLAALLALAACNFPTSQGAQETPSPRLMVSVRTAAEVRSGPRRVV